MAAESTTLFISVQYLRDNSIINENVDSKVLLPVIRMAQTKYIQQVIGTTLYNKLLADIDATSVTGNYKILIDEYIIPVLVQYSVYESIPYLNYKLRNKSVSKQGSDNSIPADLNELSYLRDNVLQTAQFYAERMSMYICNNTNLFPEFNQSNLDIAPDSQNYFGGYHIPKKYNTKYPISRNYRF